MKVLTFGEGRKALSFGEYKINLHVVGKEFTPHALRPRPGSIDVCLLTETPLDNVIQHLLDHGVPVIEGPVLKNGACSTLNSVYINDPEGNLSEISNPINNNN